MDANFTNSGTGIAFYISLLLRFLCTSLLVSTYKHFFHSTYILLSLWYLSGIILGTWDTQQWTKQTILALVSLHLVGMGTNHKIKKEKPLYSKSKYETGWGVYKYVQFYRQWSVQFVLYSGLFAALLNKDISSISTYEYPQVLRDSNFILKK